MNKRGNKKQTIFTVLLMGCLFCTALLLGGCGKNDLDMDRFDVELKYGYDNMIQVETFAPFQIQVTNNGKDFQGVVQLIIPDQFGNTMYEKELSIQAGTSKTITLTGEVANNIHNVNVRIADNKERVVWKDLFQIMVLTKKEELYIGVLSDDFSALSYFDRQPLMNYYDMTTRMFELKADTFPDDANALDMLDAIVISDFSTDILSDNQITALRSWVDNGGTLIVGTGSTYNKTLSKLNHDFFEVTPGGLTSQSTQFGNSALGYMLQQKEYEIYTSNPNADEDTEYMEWFEKNFALDYFEQLYLYDFLYYYNITEEDWEDEALREEYLLAEFYVYCFYQYYNDYYRYQNWEPEYVTVDVLTLEGTTTDTTDILYGETQDTTSLFELGYISQMGDGNIFLATVDFTKNPLPQYTWNSMFFVNVLERTMGERCSQDYYYYYDSDYQSWFQETTLSTGMPQMPFVLIYAILLVIYFAIIFALYFIMHKKGKTNKLWVIYPVVAGGMALLIYCAGFSTRMFRPAVSVASVLHLQETQVSKTSIMTVTVPKNKEYDVSVAKNYSVKMLQEGYFWGDWTEDADCDYDSYTSAYSTSLDSNNVAIVSPEALGKRDFLLQTSYARDGKTIEMKRTGVDSFEVTNAYGCDLEAAYIFDEASEKLFYIGDIKDGETKQISGGVATRSYVVLEDVQDYYMDDSGNAILMGVLFGNLSSSFENYQMNCLSLIMADDYRHKQAETFEALHPDSDYEKAFFAACPVKKEKGIYQSGTDYRERCAETVCVIVD